MSYYFKPEMTGGATSSLGHLATYPGYLLERKDLKNSFIPRSIIKSIQPRLEKHHLPSPLVHATGEHFTYELLDLIDSGAYSAVYRAKRSDSNEIIALKIHKQTEEYLIAGMMESAIVLKFLHNDGFLPVQDIFFGPNCHLCFAMPLCATSLLKFKHKLYDLQFAVSIVKPVLVALKTLHKNGIVHADVKAENILIDGDKRYLIDFGSVSFESEDVSSYTLQTLFYRAPEMALLRKVTRSIDIWSLGCVLYEILVGVPLFSVNSETQLLESISCELGQLPSDVYTNVCLMPNSPWGWMNTHKLANLKRQLGPGVGEIVGDFLNKCLMLDYRSRVTAEELLEHEMLKWSESEPAVGT